MLEAKAKEVALPWLRRQLARVAPHAARPGQLRSPAAAQPGRAGAARPSVPRVRVTWLGHSTVRIDLDGVRLLTDPVLTMRVLHLRRAEPVDPAALGSIDAVLLSHGHWDHFHHASLRRLPRSTTVVVPRGLGRLLRLRRFERVVEVGVGDRLELGAVGITATHAEHPGSRGLARARALGYMVRGTRSVYFAGDTDLFAEMAELAPVDLALLPVSGWGPRLPAGHLDPRRAAEALVLLCAAAAVPIHWGTLLRIRTRDHGSRPAEEFRRLAAELAPDVAVHVLALNGSLEL
jgi:L-ascorbate metabolism protein UlaG (beta-lactamase superfamily)